MLTETTRNKVIIAIFLLAAAGALISGTFFSAGVIQALIFSAMAATAAILTTFLVVALN
ncbi:hypothetical protein [Bosea thiooxidans]